MAIVIVKTTVTVLTAIMMQIILLFAKGKDRATVIGFSYMEALYIALLWLVWRG